MIIAFEAHCQLSAAGGADFGRYDGKSDGRVVIFTLIWQEVVSTRLPRYPTTPHYPFH